MREVGELERKKKKLTGELRDEGGRRAGEKKKIEEERRRKRSRREREREREREKRRGIF